MNFAAQCSGIGVVSNIEGEVEGMDKRYKAGKESQERLMMAGADHHYFM